MADIGISPGQGKQSFRQRPWKNANGTTATSVWPNVVVLLGFNPEGTTPVQMDFVGHDKLEDHKSYWRKLIDWANNDYKAHKGGAKELWWVHVDVQDTARMKPRLIKFFHDNSPEAKLWQARIEDTIKANPLDRLTEVRGKGPWGNKVAAPAAAVGGKPERKVRKVAAQAAPAQAGDKPVRKIRKPKAA